MPSFLANRAVTNSAATWSWTDIVNSANVQGVAATGIAHRHVHDSSRQLNVYIHVGPDSAEYRRPGNYRSKRRHLVVKEFTLLG